MAPDKGFKSGAFWWLPIGEYQIIKKAVESTLREKVAALQSEQPKVLEKDAELSTASPSEILGY